LEGKDSRNNKSDFTKVLGELQIKFDKLFEYVRSLRDENEVLRAKVKELEQEVEKLKRENEQLREGSVVLLSQEEREELKSKISLLLKKMEQYL
jgi:predicted nuclease with TOPRIM domain